MDYTKKCQTLGTAVRVHGCAGIIDTKIYISFVWPDSTCETKLLRDIYSTIQCHARLHV